MSNNVQKAPRHRGRAAVEAALIEAACDMLANAGPNTMSVRDVAAKAGVNHGQVHHYFGGKQGLIEAAVLHLAKEHYEHAMERAAGNSMPPALSLGEDSQYLKTIVRLVLDGEVEAAVQVEANEGISVPQETMKVFLKQQNISRKKIPPEIKAVFAARMALELGWAALEPYLLLEANVQPHETEEVRAHAKKIAERMLQQTEEDTPRNTP